jgi:predicted helicase
MTIQDYIKKVSNRFELGILKENYYRSDLEVLIRHLIIDVKIINEPTHITDCGNPKYVITKKTIPIGYIETKGIGKNLNHKRYKEQFERYKTALDNLILTDYIWFQLFQNGELVHEVRIGKLENNIIKPLFDHFCDLKNLIQSFCAFISPPIRSSKKLAKTMASKTKLLRNVLEHAIRSDEKRQEDTLLKNQYTIFKKILIYDLTPETFADLYAQTLAYGMFATWLHDKALNNFSKQAAAKLIPKSNLVLSKIFEYIASPDIDKRIVRTVDTLTHVFRAIHVELFFKNFSKSTHAYDPLIHFYEEFLSQYDPKLRKSLGVWYTSKPVVHFMIRAVDDILKAEFNISQGLTDTTKTKLKGSLQGQKFEKDIHKVQILDPATGTGTFLAEIVQYIYTKKFKIMQENWSEYIDQHLIPRLNGFEILMASYSMAHLKLDQLLAETNYKPTINQRFNIYLTNTLEEQSPNIGTLFSSWLSIETNEADHIKHDKPVMCIIGNPPYSVSSSNKSKWIEELMNEYKKDLNERNIQPLSDDYIKFIRYGQHFIDKIGKGILAYISNHSFIDGIIHRQMRKSLLETFDKIYILDLHGNLKKKEITPDGKLDQNVFDIMQGVSINIFIKKSKSKSKSKKLGQVLHYGIYGQREDKYRFLNQNSLISIQWNTIKNRAPNYFFIKKDFKVYTQYKKGFDINSLFILSSSGIQSEFDIMAYSNSRCDAENKVHDLRTMPTNKIILKYGLKTTQRKKIDKAKDDLLKNTYKIYSIQYKAFSYLSMIYTGQTNGLMGRPRTNSVKHTLKDNISLVLMRSLINSPEYNSIFISNISIDKNFYGFQTYFFPLYLYPETKTNDIYAHKRVGQEGKKLNLNMEIVDKISKNLDLKFEFNEGEGEGEDKLTPINILDYIYAVLHSPTYRQKYKEFLKVDFPKVPYPKTRGSFWELVYLGSKVRKIHLLDNLKVEEYNIDFPIVGNNIIRTQITQKSWEITDLQMQLGRVWINAKQYFENIPLMAWEFYIGGDQPAQKWLKNKKRKPLSTEEILHYQKIIIALLETAKLMKEIDKIRIE